MASSANGVFPKKFIWFLLLLVLAASVTVGCWWFQGDTQPNQNLLTVEVERGDLEDLVGQNGPTERREVTVGVSNRVQAEILDGLEDGDRPVNSPRSAGSANKTSARFRRNSGRLTGLDRYGPKHVEYHSGLSVGRNKVV